MFPFFWPITIGSVIGYEVYKRTFMKPPAHFIVQPNRLYFAQALSSGPNPDPNVLISDLVGVGLKPTQGILRDTKNPALWSFLVQSGNTPPSPVLQAILTSRLTLIALDDRGAAS